METTELETTQTAPLVVVDPKEFGLDESKAKEVESVFTPLIIEREALAAIYKTVITKEMSKELVNEAYQLRLKLVKVRTGTDKVHKSAKAFYLAGGRFVDAWRNKNNVAIEQMEEKLSEIENYYINLEKARIEKLQSEREAELLKYEVENVTSLSLGVMAEQVWNNFLTGTKSNYEARKEAERKAEAERIERERKEAEEREAQRLENIRLKEEAEKRERELEMERQEAAEKLRAAQKKAELERKEAEERARKEKEAADAILDKERRERIRVENELKAKQESEEKRIAEEKAEKERLAKEAEEKEQAELDKGDADKIIDLKNDLAALKTKYVFKSAKNTKTYAEVGMLLDKIINHINK